MYIGQAIYNFFWKVSGEDPQILKEAKGQLQLRFLCSGILVFLLFWLSVFSYHHSFNKLFKIPTLSWIIALVFTMMIINIYRLNIITLAPKKLKYSFGYFVSLSIRVLFIILISLTIVKPLETILLHETVSNEVNSLKALEIEESLCKTELYYDTEIATTEKELQGLQEKIIDNRIVNAVSKEEYLIKKLDQLKKEKTTQIEETKRLLNNSSFFVRSLIVVNKKNPQIWLLTILLVTLFLTPFILKFTTSPSGFYSRKRMILHDKIIEEEYSLFKKIYPKAFLSSIGEALEIIENFEDPPFNTLRKKDDRVIGLETDYIKHLYGNQKD